MTAPHQTSQTTPSGRASSRSLALHAVDALLERKAQDVTVLDLREVTGAVADFFVIGTGGSDRQVRALANTVNKTIAEQANEQPWHEEGKEHLQWVVLDYVDMVVHLFSPDRRSYYDLERLWGDAKSERVEEDASANDVGLLQPSAQPTS